MSVYLGIDPGLSGFLAVLSVPSEEAFEEAPGYHVTFHQPPTVEVASGRKRYDLARGVWLGRHLAKEGAVSAVIEKAQPMPKNGGIANFRSGEGYMFWRLVLKFAGIPFEAIPAQTWKAELRVRGQGSTRAARRKDGKARAIAKAQELYPGVSLLPTTRSRVPNDGMAEALLLAHLARTA